MTEVSPTITHDRIEYVDVYKVSASLKGGASVAVEEWEDRGGKNEARSVEARQHTPRGVMTSGRVSARWCVAVGAAGQADDVATWTGFNSGGQWQWKNSLTVPSGRTLK